MNANSVDESVPAEAGKAVVGAPCTAGIASGEALGTTVEGIEEISVLASIGRNRTDAV